MNKLKKVFFSAFGPLFVICGTWTILAFKPWHGVYYKGNEKIIYYDRIYTPFHKKSYKQHFVCSKQYFNREQHKFDSFYLHDGLASPSIYGKDTNLDGKLDTIELSAGVNKGLILFRMGYKELFDKTDMLFKGLKKEAYGFWGVKEQSEEKPLYSSSP